jgi:hypothetical protein
LRNTEGVLEIAAKINALFVADFDPGTLNLALIGTDAALNSPRNGALQFVICTSLPSTTCG